jgi:hypothetical protein
VRPFAIACACAALLACAGAPSLHDSAKSGVYGYLKLVPHEGLGPRAPTAGSPSGAYADRRYAGAELVDYSKPGFAVVYLDGPEPPGARAPFSIAIQGAAGGVRLEPPNGAVAVGGEVVVRNYDERPRVVSVPAADVLRALAPGDTLAIEAREPGALEIFVPDAPGAEARVFAAPGPFAAVNEAGRFELVDVEPGERRLRTWHPRFPPSARAVSLEPGRVLRVDLEIGVGLPQETADHDR